MRWIICVRMFSFNLKFHIFLSTFSRKQEMRTRKKWRGRKTHMEWSRWSCDSLASPRVPWESSAHCTNVWRSLSLIWRNNTADVWRKFLMLSVWNKNFFISRFCLTFHICNFSQLRWMLSNQTHKRIHSTRDAAFFEWLPEAAGINYRHDLLPCVWCGAVLRYRFQ